ncbi:MAG: HEAT repeat domain-containing protein [Anaerolineales bacterium]|jgi:HEAT repeat protein
MKFFGLFGRPNIGALKAKGEIDELIKALSFPDDHNVRFEAAAALGDVGDSNCIEPLIAALDDCKRVREVAIRSLGKIGDQQAIPSLVEALQDEDWEIRSMATRSLGTIGDESAIEPLINALEKESESVRWYTLQALSNITGENSNQNIDEWKAWFQQNQQKGNNHE